MGGKCVRKVATDADEVLEVVNSYLSIPVTAFAVSRMEQVECFFDMKALKLMHLVSGEYRY